MCEADSIWEDQAFATGCMEVMFTLDGAHWRTKVNHVYQNTATIGLWGQIEQPLSFCIHGYSSVFGIRFLSSSATFLLRDNIDQFNNQVVDLATILGNPLIELHGQLQEATSVQQQIELVEAYLIQLLTKNVKVIPKIDLVHQVVKVLTHKDFNDTIDNVAEQYGITARYLQKVFVQHTGLSPKLLIKINRFQNSLVLMEKNKYSLTTIAHECGYYDQSHFVREFKSFAGYAPSGFQIEKSTAVLASPNK